MDLYSSKWACAYSVPPSGQCDIAVVTRHYFAVTFLITLFTRNACGAFPNYIPNLRRGNGDGDALIEDYFGLGFSYSEVSSLLCWKLSLVGAFPLRSVCVPFREETLAMQASGGGGGGGKTIEMWRWWYIVSLFTKRF